MPVVKMFNAMVTLTTTMISIAGYHDSWEG